MHFFAMQMIPNAKTTLAPSAHIVDSELWEQVRVHADNRNIMVMLPSERLELCIGVAIKSRSHCSALRMQVLT